MRPSVDEIRRAAYDRWERRGWDHGGDCDDWLAAETELTFRANYRTIVEHELQGPGARVLGEPPARRCRFCERNAGPAGFGAPRPLFAGNDSLLTPEVCDDCQSDWRDGLDAEFRDFWVRLGRDHVPASGERSPFTVAAFKAMACCAFLMMPGSDLRYFLDALEWVSNTDHDADDRLLDGAKCRVYRAAFLGRPGRASLARRIDDEAPVPYMLFFLEWEGIMVQVPLPMCLRDEDLDGREIEHLERIPAVGYGHGYRETRGVLFPLSVSARQARRPSLISALAS